MVISLYERLFIKQLVNELYNYYDQGGLRAEATLFEDRAQCQKHGRAVEAALGGGGHSVRGVLVVYLAMALFISIAENSGYHGFSTQGFEASYVYEKIEEAQYASQNQSFSLIEVISPISALVGFGETLIKIIIRSLIFQVSIEGAPDEVNLIIKTVMGAMAWIGIWDLIAVFAMAIAEMLKGLFRFLF